MTETTPTDIANLEQQGATTSGPSGVDLARLALHQARQDAKQRGNDRPGAPRPKKKAAIQFHGRTPVGLGGIFQGLMANRGWDVPAAGGSILDRWSDIATAVAPKLATHSVAVAFDAETGQLDLLPDSPAYATQLRLMTPGIIAAANQRAGAAAVRTIRVRQPGVAPTTPAPAGATVTVPAGPMKTRETASAGFRRTLAAHHTAWTPFQQDPALAAAVGRQEQFRRDLAAQVFPDLVQDQKQEDEAPTSWEGIRAQQRQINEAVRITAILRARAERAGRPTVAAAPALCQAG
ncbi:DciA family protein [Streptomyces zaomyceticus]|uniref:DciA family protein n=1 Tax=Streptomyces zaomyceticus TaxID=68286 RepID=UPI0033ADC3AF